MKFRFQSRNERIRTIYGVFIPRPTWICPCMEISGLGFHSEPLKPPKETLEGIPAPSVVLPKGPEVWNDISLLLWDLHPWLLGSQKSGGFSETLWNQGWKSPISLGHSVHPLTPGFSGLCGPRGFSCPTLKALKPRDFHHSHWDTIPKLP